MANDNAVKGDILLLIIILMLIASCIVFGISLFFGFCAAILISFPFLIKRGFKPIKLIQLAFEAVKECRLLYILVLLIGAAISVWMASGVVPAMIYYGFEYMKGMNFLLAVFFITSLISFFMGTAVGTISTIGIALLGIGKGFGVPEAVILGAAVSGSFIADKISPISGLLNLTLTSTGTTYREALKSMVKTLIPVYIITCIFYYIIGNVYVVNIDLKVIEEYQSSIAESFYVSPILLLIPVGVLIMSIYGVKIIPTVTASITAGVILSTILQCMPLTKVLYSIFFGYKGTTSSHKLNTILVSGGMMSMMEVLFIVASVVALAGILEKTGILTPILEKVLSKATSSGDLIIKTALISSTLTIVTCDQTVGIILPGRLLKEKYTEFGLKNGMLTRTISDTGTIIAPLMPWNVNGLIISMITGISALQYAPYSALCFLFPMVTLALGYIMKKNGPSATFTQ